MCNLGLPSHGQAPHTLGPCGLRQAPWPPMPISFGSLRSSPSQAGLGQDQVQARVSWRGCGLGQGQVQPGRVGGVWGWEGRSSQLDCQQSWVSKEQPVGNSWSISPAGPPCRGGRIKTGFMHYLHSGMKKPDPRKPGLPSAPRQHATHQPGPAVALCVALVIFTLSLLLALTGDPLPIHRAGKELQPRALAQGPCCQPPTLPPASWLG